MPNPRPDRSSARRRRPAPPKPTVNPAPAGLEGGAYRPLSEAQIERIVAAGYEVLERTGVEILPSPCRDRLAAAGCRVEPDRNRVYFPPKLIEDTLKFAPSEVLLADRHEGADQGSMDLKLGGRRVYLGTGGTAVKIMDLDGSVRETRLSDNYHIGRLCDALEHVHFYMRPAMARDLENAAIDINQFYACLSATRKHVMANCYEPQNVAKLRALGEMLAGGPAAFDARPLVSCSNCWTVSPLRFAIETVEILDELVAHNIPTALSSAPQAGATSPAALAGTLVQIVAEQLSGFTYVNLLRPGFPALFGCVPAQADLRSGAFTGGSAEFALLHAACAQIAQHLKLPIYNSSGIADSKLGDAQAGFEKGLTTTAAALAGSNYVHHSAGFLESLLTVAYEQFVIDNDINGAAMRLVRGIEVTDETLSLDVIEDVARGPNHFLGHPQTLALMQSEYLYPALFDRRPRDDWQAAGGLSLRYAAKERAREILESHWPDAIAPDLDAEIRQRFDIRLPREEMCAGGWTG
ncbi:MAG: trimethylamine methyltransferase family protein [Rhodobacteraceae bacterium]|nr:trimethylamine methyltransferase family protein [Paracoccaceae bacterium]